VLWEEDTGALGEVVVVGEAELAGVVEDCETRSDSGTAVNVEVAVNVGAPDQVIVLEDDAASRFLRAGAAGAAFGVYFTSEAVVQLAKGLPGGK
jgi:hypothetical protein